MELSALSFTIDRCRLCESRELVSVLDLGRQPLANQLRRDKAEVLPTFPLAICRCGACGTIQLTETVTPDLLFTQYVWVTGTSEAARRYSCDFCDRMIERSRSGPLFVVEVASNDGTFLKPFAKRGDRVLGIDPARNIAAMAEQSGIPTMAEFFGLTLADAIVARSGEADVVFARNVVAHVADANDVVAGLARCLRADGTGAIEFHRADIILEELHYDSIYHEHLFYHSLHSIQRLLDRFGLTPFDVETSPISGGSLVVYFSKLPRPRSRAFDQMIAHEREVGVGRAEPWRAFADRCRRHAAGLKALIEARRAQGKRMIGYGASARSATLLNFCGITARDLAVIADRSPLKHHLYAPGTDILIVPPREALATNPDTVVLLGWNFRDEILEQIRTEHGWDGEVIVPLPGDAVVLA